MGRTASRWLLALGLLGCLNAPRGEPGVGHPRRAQHRLSCGLDSSAARQRCGAAGIVRRALTPTRPSSSWRSTSAKFDALEATTWMMAHGALPKGTKLRGRARRGALRSASAPQPPISGCHGAALDDQAPWMVGWSSPISPTCTRASTRTRGSRSSSCGARTGRRQAHRGPRDAAEELSGLVALSQEDQIRMLDETLDELKDLKSEMQDVLSAWRQGDAARWRRCSRASTAPFPHSTARW